MVRSNTPRTMTVRKEANRRHHEAEADRCKGCTGRASGFALARPVPGPALEREELKQTPLPRLGGDAAKRVYARCPLCGPP